MKATHLGRATFARFPFSPKFGFLRADARKNRLPEAGRRSQLDWRELAVLTWFMLLRAGKPSGAIDASGRVRVALYGIGRERPLQLGQGLPPFNRSSSQFSLRPPFSPLGPGAGLDGLSDDTRLSLSVVIQLMVTYADDGAIQNSVPVTDFIYLL